MNRNVAGLLLAAGRGSRIGTPKALIELGGRSLARRGIELLQAGGAAPVIVVTGAGGAGDLGPDTGGAGLASAHRASAEVVSVPASGPSPDTAATVLVHNPDWATGMGSSLAAGLAAVPAACGAAVIALADQPLVGPAAVARLLAAYAAGAEVAVACYEGRPRNPVLIARAHFAEVARLAVGDVGARPFLRARPELITAVECGDTGRPDDIDTPEDLSRVAAELAGPAASPG